MEQVLEAIIKETNSNQKYSSVHENASKALRKCFTLLIALDKIN